MTPWSKVPGRWNRKTLGRAVIASVVVTAALAALVGGFHEGYIGPVDSQVHTENFGTWALYATANSVAAIAIVGLISTPLGIALGWLISPRRGVLQRWLELACALPAFVLTALWVANSPGAELIVLSLCVATHRSLQLAVLLSRAAHSRSALPLVPLNPIPELEVAELWHWRPLLWVAAAHSAALLVGEHAALVLLGIVNPTPNTWLSTVCAAAVGTPDVSPLAWSAALLGLFAVPWALWVQALPTAPPLAKSLNPPN